MLNYQWEEMISGVQTMIDAAMHSVLMEVDARMSERFQSLKEQMTEDRGLAKAEISTIRSDVVSAFARDVGQHKDALSATVQSMTREMMSSFSENLRLADERAKGIKSDLATAVESFRAWSESIEQKHIEDRRSIEERLGRLEALDDPSRTELDDLSSAIKIDLEDLRKTQRLLRENMDAMSVDIRRVETLAQEVQGQTEALKTVSHELQRAKKSIAGIQDDFVLMAAEQERLSEDHTEVRESQDVHRQDVTLLLENFAAEARETREAMDAELRVRLADQGTLIAKRHEELENHLTRVDTASRESQDAHREDVTLLLENLAAETRATCEAIDSELRIRLADQGTLIAKRHGELENRLTRIDTALDASTARMDMQEKESGAQRMRIEHAAEVASERQETVTEKINGLRTALEDRLKEVVAAQNEIVMRVLPDRVDAGIQEKLQAAMESARAEMSSRLDALRDRIAGMSLKEGPQGPMGYLADVVDHIPGSTHPRGAVVYHPDSGGTYQAKHRTDAPPVDPDHWQPLVRGIASVSLSPSDEGHKIVVRLSDGESLVSDDLMGPAGRSPRVRGAYSPASKDYRELDIVAFKNQSWIARTDDPGICPGPGWMLLARKGARGEQGLRGDRGSPGVVWKWRGRYDPLQEGAYTPGSVVMSGVGEARGLWVTPVDTKAVPGSPGAPWEFIMQAEG